MADVKPDMKFSRWSTLAAVLAALMTAARGEKPDEPLWTFETGG
jgi:hypothetical protein